jgi:hypothetical protein
LTVFDIEYMPIDCTHIDGHVDQLIDVGEFQQRPQWLLDLNPLSNGRFGEPGKRWWQGEPRRKSV